MNLDAVVKELTAESREDYVGLWQLARNVPCTFTGIDRTNIVITIASEMLSVGSMMLGQFQEDQFVPWTGPKHAQLERLRSELIALGRDPDIGEVAWLAVM